MTRRPMTSLLASVSMLATCIPVFGASPVAIPAVRSPMRDPFQIAVRADRRALDPVLAVRQDMTGNPGVAAFVSYSNYRAYIERAEIRIFRSGKNAPGDKPLAIVPLDRDGRAFWTLPADLPDAVDFTLRAYGKGGRWDETGLHPLVKPGQAAPGHFAAFGRNDEAVYRTIAISGVTLTVQGRTGAQGRTVAVNGASVPPDRDGLFMSQQVVPKPTGTARVEIKDGDRPVLTADRHYDANKNRWFIVGQGDVTFSRAVSKGPAAAMSGNALAQGDHVSSRGAFYAKGLIGQDYRVTASLDTGESLVKDLLKNIDRKDPAQLLRRVDERYQYPTFGDGSTTVEDAPSQGRFYLRVQKDDSNLVVGNFITAAQGTELVQLDRGLFGALLDYRSRGLTKHGDRKRQLLAFASNPGTITASDELRGTGGSLYYLRHQDLSIGSERLRLEVRSPRTGAVLANTPLRLGEDYEIDYYQGRVTLLRPLNSYLSNDELVRAGTASGNVPVLVARYEYTPAQGGLGGHSIGGRVSQWIGNWLRFGVTGQSETSMPADQLLLGGDVMLKGGPNTWLKAEYGRSDGPGFGQSASLDGGLNFTDAANNTPKGQVARAWRLEAALDENDLGKGLRGKAGGYYENYEAGYAAFGRASPNPMRRWGANLDQPLGRDTRLRLTYEGRIDEGIGSTKLARGEWTQALTPSWSLRTGVRLEDTRLPAGSLNMQGQRIDAGLQATYARIGAPWSVFAFGQGTVARDDDRHANNRGGAGFKWDLTRSLSAQGEVSNGTGGWAANALLTRRGRGGGENHIGYRLYSDMVDRGYDPQELMSQANRGTLVVGSRQPITDSLTLTAEEKYGHGGTAPSLSHAYGMRFIPDRTWSFATNVEKSRIFDSQPNGRPGIDRLAASIAAGYAGKVVMTTASVEYRQDKQAAGTQTSWAFRDKLDVRPNEAWHLLGRFEYAFSNSAGTSLQAADYIRGIGGLAYRPVNMDRLNILARYTYMRDLGPVGQLMTNGGTEQPKQISRVISLDLSYDLAKTVEISAKYAQREGRVSITRASDDFVNSAANLYAVRADVRIARNWTLLTEGRLLTTSLSGDSRAGALVAAYRDLGKGIKLGVGYNFADYSSDLTDQSYSSRGFFVNLLAAF